MSNFKKYFSVLSLSFILPVIAGAQVLGKTTNLFTSAKVLINTILIPIVFSLALLVFFWGVVKYIWAEGQSKEDGKKIMIWGIVALFVMSSVWGLVSFLNDEFLGGTRINSTNVPVIN